MDADADEAKCCISCSSNQRRLSALSGFKLCSNQPLLKSIINYLEISHLPRTEFTRLFICDPCLKKYETFDSFVNIARENCLKLCKALKTKRALSTPENPKQPKRQRVIDFLSSSIEKLKIQKARENTGGTNPRRALFHGEAVHEDELFATPIQADHVYAEKRCCEHTDADIHIDMESYMSILRKPPMVSSEKQLNNMYTQIRQMCAPRVSVLSGIYPDSLSNSHVFGEAVKELSFECPFLFDVLNKALGEAIPKTSKLATIATIYGMILHSNNCRISAIQRLFTTSAVRHHADNKLLSVLNKIHITLSNNTKAKLLNSFSNEWDSELIKTISAGKDGKLNGDNVDLYVETNDIRMDNKSRDYHFFASNWVADRVNLTPIPDDHAIGKFEDVSVESFIPNDQEIKLFRDYLETMIGRVLQGNFTHFHWLKKILPKHIPHEHQDEMSEKSSIHLLPIMLKNEAKYDDCVDIMDSYVKHIRDIYSKAGRGGDLDQLLVPIGGDQLTRVRLQGAKSLRQGAHDPQERFDMLSPCIIELFHTMQDFVEKLCKKFLKMDNAKDQCTLANLRLQIQRSNVNGNVKSRFDAHDQFVTAVGTAYILSLCMKLFGMKNLSDEPQASENFPGNAANLHHENKEKVFRFICDQIIDASFIPPLRLEMLKEQANEIFVAVSVNGTKTVLKVPVVNDQITLSVQACGVNMRVSSQQIKKGVTVNLPEYSINIEEEKPLDQLNCYAINFLNWYYVLLVFKDVIAEGNLEMTNIVLKFLIPLFYSHSKYSKYMVECIDFILKTEYLLTPRMSLKVRAGAFINVTGQSGKNKAADMHKENEVKQIKQAIKSLGANKTEKSIVKISKANPVIERISENLCCMLDIQSCKTTHKSRSEDVDISTLVDQLMQNDVWNLSHGRQLASFPNMSKSSYTFDFDSFKDCCMNTAQRLRRGVMLRDEESESESDLED